jgi:hypothetical protein
MDSGCRAGSSDQETRQQHEHFARSHSELNSQRRVSSLLQSKWRGSASALTPGNPGHQRLMPQQPFGPCSVNTASPSYLGHQPQQLGAPDMRTAALFLEIQMTQEDKAGALAALRTQAKFVKRQFGHHVPAVSSTGTHLKKYIQQIYAIRTMSSRSSDARPRKKTSVGPSSQVEPQVRS